MADETRDSAGVKVIANAVAVAEVPAPLSVRSVNVVLDSHNRSPHGLATEIVEVELWPANQGNADWMQFCDVLRFRCERGKSAAMLELLGLKPAK